MALLKIAVVAQAAAMVLLTVKVEKHRRAIREVNSAVSHLSDVCRLLAKRTEPARRAPVAEPF